MYTHIVLLRGVNVSGKNILKMALLKEALIKNGVVNPLTYIQSGNLVIKTKLSASETQQKIQHILKNQFELDVPALVVSFIFLKKVLQECPFAQNLEKLRQSYFTFLWKSPEGPENIAKFNAYQFPNEEVHLKHDLIYSFFEKGAARAKTTSKLIENTLKVTATTRNFNTVKKLIELSQ